MSTRRTCPCVSFWTPDGQTNISGHLPVATGDSFSRVELLFGNPEEGEAPALHIASGDVRNAFHHMGIPERLRLFFVLETFVSSRFQRDGEDRSGVHVSAEQKLFPVPLTLPVGFMEHVLLLACRPPTGELCGFPFGFASYHLWCTAHRSWAEPLTAFSLEQRRQSWGPSDRCLGRAT